MAHPTKHNRVAYLNALCRTVPFHIVERVLIDPTEQAITIQIFDGTVVILDLVGFTALCERLALSGDAGVSRLSQVLDRLYTRLLEEAVFPFRGYLVQFGGDSLTIAFRSDDHALRAAASALTCQQLLRGPLNDLFGDTEDSLMARVGLASGEIRLPVLGDLTRRASACAGPTAHRALDMQRRALPNVVTADAACLALLGADIEVGPAIEGGAVVAGLKRWPPREPRFEENAYLTDRVEEKIALLEPFVPQPLALRLKGAPMGWRLDGEMRDLVILFAELWGFDNETNVGEAAIRTSLHMSRSLLRCFYKYGGVVSKMDLAERGHRIMVLFGLQPADNDAERALLAALEASARVRGFAADRSLGVALRCGVHCGQVYSGAIGSDLKHDITVIGDAVNVAARVTGAAEPFEILATDAIMQAVRSRFQTTPRSPLAVKGKREPLTLHAVHGMAEGRAHYVRKRERTRFCAGRDRELAALHAAIDAAFDGRSQLVGVGGESGTGKSYLLAGVIDRWIERGGTGILGRCRYATRSLPLAPVAVMMNSYLGLAPGDSEERRRARLREGLLAKIDVAGGAPELISLLQPVDRPDGADETILDLADAHARDRLLAQVMRFIEQRLPDEPLLYIIEDLQLADSLTLQLIQQVSLLPRQQPFLMLGTYRPDPLLDHVRRCFDVDIDLSPLDADQVGALLRHEFGVRQVADEVVEFVWRRTAGNPEHAVEIARFIKEHRLITVRSETALPPAPGMSLLDEVVPPTLAQVALARLSELGEVERRLLRTASAIGRSFSRNLLERATPDDLEPDLVDSAVSALEVQRVLVPDAEEQTSYMFRDDLVRAVTYKTIPELERRQVHARIADALERLPEHDSRRTATMLALHRERAAQYAAAAHWFEQAIELAARAGLDRETEQLAGHWQDVATQLAPGERTEPRKAAAIVVRWLVALGRQGKWTLASQVYRLIQNQHREALDPAALHVVDYWVGETFAALGDLDHGREKLEHVYLAAREPGLRCDAARRVAQLHAFAGRFGDAEAWLERAAEQTHGDEQRQLQVNNRWATLKLAAGDLEAARAILVRVRQRSEEIGYFDALTRATTNLGYCELLLDNLPAATESFERALTANRASGHLAAEANSLVNLGQAAVWAGQFERGRTLLERALALAEEVGDRQVAAEARVHLGAAIALSEDVATGSAICRSGRDAARQTGLIEGETAACLHLLRIAVAQRDRAAADEQLKACRAIESRFRAPLFAHCYAELKTLAAALG